MHNQHKMLLILFSLIFLPELYSINLLLVFCTKFNHKPIIYFNQMMNFSAQKPENQARMKFELSEPISFWQQWRSAHCLLFKFHLRTLQRALTYNRGELMSFVTSLSRLLACWDRRRRCRIFYALQNSKPPGVWGGVCVRFAQELSS